MFRKVLGSVCLSVAMWNTDLRAAMILADKFDYPDGILQIVSTNKWVGHSGTTNQVDVSQGALNLTGAETQDVNALLSGQPYLPISGGMIYAGFDLKLSALPSKSGAYFAHFKDATNDFRGRIWTLANGAASGSFRLGISSGSSSAAAVVLNTDLQTGVSYKVVCSLVVSNAAFTLWLNPKSESDTHILVDASGGIPIAAFAFRQATGIGTMTIDNVVVGTAFQDIVPRTPEPPSSTSEATQANPATSPTAAPQINQVATVAPVPLVITLQPESRTVAAGQDVSFEAQARGAEPMVFQWQFNQKDIPAATNQVLAISKAGPAQQGDYRVVVQNPSGQATSIAARLTVIGPEPPQISSQPISLTIDQGQTANFFIAATGTAPLSYQWRLGGADIAGATEPTLTLSNAQVSQSGDYRVIVRNSAGSVESEIATLAVNATVVKAPADTSKLPIVRFTNYLTGLICPGDRLTNTFSEHALRPGETLTMRVQVSASDKRPVTLSMADARPLPASARWEFRETVGTNLSATFTFAPTRQDLGSNYVISVNTSNATGTNAATWWFHVPTEAEQQIVISEFLANPATTETAPHFNPLRRAAPPPNPSWNDEFVELVNDSERDVDLSNWALFDSEHVRHRFTEPFVLRAKGAIVVYGGPRVGFPPLLMTPTIWANASATGLGLDNSGNDAIILRNPEGQLVSRLVYSEIISAKGSLTRFPTLTDDFVPHESVSASPTSPGVNYDGRRFNEVSPWPPAPLALTVRLERSAGVVLTWSAERDRSYSVLHAENPAGPFSSLATRLRFLDASGRYEVGNLKPDGTRFYRISIP